MYSRDIPLRVSSRLGRVPSRGLQYFLLSPAKSNRSANNFINAGVQSATSSARVRGIPKHPFSLTCRRQLTPQECRGRSPLPGTLSGGQVIRGVPEKYFFISCRRRRPVNNPPGSPCLNRQGEPVTTICTKNRRN